MKIPPLPFVTPEPILLRQKRKTKILKLKILKYETIKLAPPFRNPLGG